MRKVNVPLSAVYKHTYRSYNSLEIQNSSLYPSVVFILIEFGAYVLLAAVAL